MERIEVATIDLRSSLDQAKERVLAVIEQQRPAISLSAPSCHASAPVTDEAASPFGYRGPGKNGDPFAD